MLRTDFGDGVLLRQDHADREKRQQADGELRRQQVQGAQRRPSYPREYIYCSSSIVREKKNESKKKRKKKCNLSFVYIALFYIFQK
jgi:hypothetical protein